MPPLLPYLEPLKDSQLLSSRARKLLSRLATKNNVDTIDKLCELTSDDVLGVPNCGVVTLGEIRRFLTVNDRHFSQSYKNAIYQRFSDLALGARFHYLEYPDQIWIKISGEDYGLIAKYDREAFRQGSWTGQSICSFADTLEELQTLEVVLCE